MFSQDRARVNFYRLQFLPKSFLLYFGSLTCLRRPDSAPTALHLESDRVLYFTEAQDVFIYFFLHLLWFDVETSTQAKELDSVRLNASSRNGIFGSLEHIWSAASSLPSHLLIDWILKLALNTNLYSIRIIFSFSTSGLMDECSKCNVF